MSFDEICSECNQEWNEHYKWCKPCNPKHLQNDFNNLISGNDKIDKFIQDAQLNASYLYEVIEWIPYDRFKDVKQIGEGGFGTIHYARRIDGYIEKWDFENQQWKRYQGEGKISDFGLSNPDGPEKKNIFGVLPYIAPEVLSGYEEYSKAADVYSFGIIAYEMITGFPPYPDIPHDEDLAIKICNGLRPKIPFHTPKLITRIIMRCWDARVTHRPSLRELWNELEKYHSDYRNYLNKEKNKDSEIVIQIKKAEEFSANQESTNTTTTTTTPLNCQTHPQAIYTSRLLNYSKLPKPKNEENFENELEELTKLFSKVLSGDEEYSKAADVYSFGIIAYEMITGFPPYPDIPHDEDLAIKICNGLRPKIPFHTPKLITRIIMRCWDARVTHRPSLRELWNELEKYHSDYRNYLNKEKNKDSEIVIQIKKAEEFSANQESTNTTTTTTTPLNCQTHPQAIYTSRLLNYSKLPKPKNEENFENELEELTKLFSNDDIDEF
ncbi:hypothetical protein Glove_155g107 [Diversispora epigaea]|uniref:Protein kinase domain-containing protein n=1 Tax=Diversispora epigaea TaxID=1348612 RepID=A0A397J174_9GLOM|nr:hypothetical protein Glove_155g107 [Diversispora epigaea]